MGGGLWAAETQTWLDYYKVWPACCVLALITICAGSEPSCPHTEHQLLLDHVNKVTGSRLDAIRDEIAGLRSYVSSVHVPGSGTKDDTKEELYQLRGQILKLTEEFDQCKTARDITSGELASTWNMVFRATAGNGQKVFDAWTTGVGTSPHKPTSMARSCSSHFRDPAINYWGALKVKYVRYSLFENGREVAFINFNGTGSDLINWFSKANVLASSWCDLHSSSTHNYFSIAGHVMEYHQRRFFVNTLYNGCPGDVGHLVVVDTSLPKMICAFDRQPSFPQFLYSKINSADQWDRQMYGRADYIAVSIQRE